MQTVSSFSSVPHVTSTHLIVAANVNIVDRFILCCRCGIACSVNPGLEAKFTGYLCILSHQLLADPNISRTSILATPATPPPFSPPRYAIWVNSLWFLSLVISLTCALLATLLQQWARRYLTTTQPPRLSPHKRARIRSFFADGVERFRLPLAVETLPTLLHVSLFLFFLVS